MEPTVEELKFVIDELVKANLEILEIVDSLAELFQRHLAEEHGQAK